MCNSPHNSLANDHVPDHIIEKIKEIEKDKTRVVPNILKIYDDVVAKNDIRPILKYYNNKFGTGIASYQKPMLNYQGEKHINIMNEAYKNGSNIYIYDVPIGEFKKKVYKIICEKENYWLLCDKNDSYFS